MGREARISQKLRACSPAVSPHQAPALPRDAPPKNRENRENRVFFGAFTIGQAAQRAPQKNTDPALAGSVRTRCPRTHNWCDRHTPHPSALAAGVPVGATYIAAVPGAPAVCVEASSTRPTSVRPAAGLRRCVRRTSRLGLFPPGQSVLQPTEQDLRLRPPDCGSPALPHVEHLHSDCRLAVFNQIPIRHLVRSPFGHISEERFEAGPHLPELTKGQRLD